MESGARCWRGPTHPTPRHDSSLPINRAPSTDPPADAKKARFVAMAVGLALLVLVLMLLIGVIA